MVLVAAGDVEHAAVVADAEKTFGSLPADGTSAASLVAAEPSHFTGSAVSVRDPDMAETGLAIAFKGAHHLDPDSVTLSVMANMLGTWSKTSGTAHHQRSKLATAIAQNNLADRISGFSTVYHDTGLFGVYAQTSNPGEIEDLSWTIMNVRSYLCNSLHASSSDFISSGCPAAARIRCERACAQAIWSPHTSARLL